ncbi:KilA-N domain-containing protein [Stutzerimonas kirkiae]|uniref:KilA-N domain-containing protein n=1 Tax=Stutzerimonas kirkiae TaxID=2211392 RepID=UPI0010384E0F|nr:KilA-N domain-containing protein [Stutzerimonas kirkiae]TBV04972.1 DNA-binding protein [Stutzerimonas kirkiae]TBV13729.1 DNA-binding protein [Stutzerimonas kirkiae]
MKAKLHVLEQDIATIDRGGIEYICITDIARYKSPDRTGVIIGNWLRNRNTIEFLGIWEQLNNPDFKVIEFDDFKKQAGLNSFTLTPKQWIGQTGAIGLVSRAGRYGGTFAQKDIAFEFASWISVEFKLYLIKEFQRLKEQEFRQLGWDIRRNLAKVNYLIHTDAIKENLIPDTLTAQQIGFVYASEADLLNMALFGVTARQWREANPQLKGNLRDHANVHQLVCLANLEAMNAHFIDEGLLQSERLVRLNQLAIRQMRVLVGRRLLPLLAAED